MRLVTFPGMEFEKILADPKMAFLRVDSKHFPRKRPVHELARFFFSTEVGFRGWNNDLMSCGSFKDGNAWVLFSCSDERTVRFQ